MEIKFSNDDLFQSMFFLFEKYYQYKEKKVWVKWDLNPSPLDQRPVMNPHNQPAIT